TQHAPKPLLNAKSRYHRCSSDHFQRRSGIAGADGAGVVTEVTEAPTEGPTLEAETPTYTTTTTPGRHR
ncbi:MAG: hypothetical protein WBV64_14760, partial [Mycobacterium sp.]